MPCRDWDTSGGPCNSAEEDRLREQVRALDALLCSTCRILEQSKFDFDTNPMLSEWWDAHKKADEEKERRLAKKRLQDRLDKDKVSYLIKLPVASLTKKDKAFLRSKGYL